MTRSLIPWKKRSDVAKSGRIEHPIEALHREMNDLFESFFGDFGFPRWPALRAAREGGLISPRFEVSETDDAVEIAAELPGMDEKDVQVTLDNGALTIEGEKKAEREEKKRGVFFSERSYGRFQRTLALPAGLDESKVKAAFKKGVLRVTIPKTPAARGSARTIKIESD